MTDFNIKNNMYRSGNVEHLACQIKAALKGYDAITEIKSSIAKGVPLDTPEFKLGNFDSLVFALTATDDGNGLEVGGSAIVRIYSHGEYLTYRYVGICNPEISHEIAEIVMSTIEFIRDHGEKKSYTGETKSAEL